MSHDHNHAPGDANRRRLAVVLALVLLYMGAEVVGGLLTNSLALLSDAGHMLSDAASIGLALFAMSMARRPRTADRTFGYHRTEILAALANGVTLVVVAVYIVVEAWHRFQDPPEVDGSTMMLIASGGLVVNLIGLAVLHGGHGDSLNLRGAWLHVLADTLGSVQAIAAGALIWAFGWNLADPVAAVLIALLVAWSSWSLLNESVNILMEASPQGVDTGEVARELTAIEGVIDIHDLHVWTITSGFHSLSAHARVEDTEHQPVLEEIQRILHERFGVEHCTVQLEPFDDCAQGCPEPMAPDDPSGQSVAETV